MMSIFRLGSFKNSEKLDGPYLGFGYLHVSLISDSLYCIYTMFLAAPAAPFARNVACRGILVIYFSVFKIYYVFLRCITISVTSRGSYKPVCHGDAMLGYGHPRSITIISTFYYGLLCSDAVSCVLTKARQYT